MEKYRKVQYAYWIVAIIIAVLSLIVIREKDNVYVIYPFLILTIALIIFHKLTIIINEEKIVAFFGFGFFKKEMKIKEMNPETIELVKTNWMTGMGIRLTSNGWLYNVKPGNAIKIVSKDRSKTFFVGTDDFDDIKRILLNGRDDKSIN